MCGVVGYVGENSCVDFVFGGLQKLEYRGYDSSGIATVDGGKLHLTRAKGKLSELAPTLSSLPKTSKLGIGHTRWATHGGPTVKNAHPHIGERIAVVHNGIIENYASLKKTLIADGAVFHSDTDTEVVLRLLESSMASGLSLKESIFAVVAKLLGAYTLGIIDCTNDKELYVVKHGSPAAIGIGENENYLASDATAFIERSTTAVFLEDGQIALVTKDSYKIWDFSGEEVTVIPTKLNWTAGSTDKKGYRHYMLKEIHEQPAVFSTVLGRLIDRETGSFNERNLALGDLDLDSITNISMVACGTAHYSCMMGRYFIEQAIDIPVNVELASEFRYREPYLNKGTLVIAVTQSGETADTLACVQHAKQSGCQVLALCNVQYSSIPRAANATLYMEAGPEIGVASTKAFTTQLLCLFIWGLGMAKKMGKKDDEYYRKAISSLMKLPILAEKAIGTDKHIEKIAKKYYESSSVIFIGRGLSYAIALEGALKLKEISYIHAEGYPAGELKHGPIALVDKHLPVIAIAPKDKYYDKTVSNIEEVKSREAQLIAIGNDSDAQLENLVDDFIGCPHSDFEQIQAILSVIPLQLFSYYVAVKRGTDVDQPRNLAKSVTVE